RAAARTGAGRHAGAGRSRVAREDRPSRRYVWPYVPLSSVPLADGIPSSGDDTGRLYARRSGRAADGGGSLRRPPPARGVLPDPVPVPWRVGRAHAMGDSRLLPGSRRPLTPTPRPGSSQGCALQGADGGGSARSPWGFPGRGPLALVSDLSR